jgi:pyrroloquinoline-quinone synthase
LPNLINGALTIPPTVSVVRARSETTSGTEEKPMAPSVTKEQKLFLQELDETIERHSMLKHPFYQAWSNGELSLETLREYSKQYYAHVANFPMYLSAVHSNCDDQPTRQLLLENLVEEEQGPPASHPELWLRFAASLGAAREEVQAAELRPETVESVARLRSLTRDSHYVEGVAALYAYESQVPDVARSKREGLAECYGLTDPGAVEYFSVHEEADIRHSADEREIIARGCPTREDQERALRAAEGAAQAMWLFLDGVEGLRRSEVAASA